jgi:hypothetical protein
MADTLTVAIGLFAQVVSGAPVSVPPVPPANQQVAQPGQPECQPATPAANQREIVICAQRPNGYRLNPDVMEAKREKRRGEGPPPGRPERSLAVQTPCMVGPEPCQSAGINLVAAGITAATMVERAAKGENVGEMFITDPHPSEYQLYLMAKKRREAREAEEKIEAKAKASTRATVAEPDAKSPQSQ